MRQDVLSGGALHARNAAEHAKYSLAAICVGARIRHCHNAAAELKRQVLICSFAAMGAAM